MTQLPTYPHATPETVWAILQENALQMKETARRIKETEKLFKETARRFKETEKQMKETDRQIKETDRQMKETDRRMEKIQKTVGGWAHNHGSFAEEYFFNAFEEKRQNFFGEHFNKIEKNVKPVLKETKDEYDIVMYNNTSIAIVETKYKAHINDIPKVLKKAKTFKAFFPVFKDYKIYLALASMSFYRQLEKECIEQGIVMIKQVGDMVVINDGHLKVF
jgi:hypothetical protein